MIKKNGYFIILIFIFLLTCSKINDKKKEELPIISNRIEVLGKVISLLVELKPETLEPIIQLENIVQEFKPVPIDDPDSVRLMDKMWLLINDWMEDKQKDLIRHAKSINVNNDSYYKFLFQAYIETNQLSSALQIAKHIVKKTPEIKFLIACCYYRTGDYDNAIAYFDSCVDDNKLAPIGYEYMGAANFKKYLTFKIAKDTTNEKSSLNEALKYWKASSKYVGTSPYLSYYIGVAYFELQYYDKAIDSFKECFENNENYLKAFLYAVEAARKQQKIEELKPFIVDIDKNVDKFKDVCKVVTLMAAYYYYLGEEFWGHNDIENAVEKWSESLNTIIKYQYCEKESILLTYFRVMLSLLYDQAAEYLGTEFPGLHEQKQTALNDLIARLEKNELDSFDKNLFCKYMGNLAFTYGFSEEAVRFYDVIDNAQKDIITQVNIIALKAHLLPDSLAIFSGKIKYMPGYDFFVNFDIINAKLMNYKSIELTEIFDLNMLMDNIPSDLKKLGVKLFLNLTREAFNLPTDSLKATVSEINQLRELQDKYMSIIKGDSMVVPKYIEVKKGKEILDFIIIPQSKKENK